MISCLQRFRCMKEQHTEQKELENLVIRKYLATQWPRRDWLVSHLYTNIFIALMKLRWSLAPVIIVVVGSNRQCDCKQVDWLLIQMLPCTVTVIYFLLSTLIYARVLSPPHHRQSVILHQCEELHQFVGNIQNMQCENDQIP